jgi:hypothetical protein
MVISYNDKEIIEKLNLAISILFKNDSYLLDVDANERSISHKLGVYLQDIFKDWDVDCEYNRIFDFEKRVDLPRKYDVSNWDTEATTVYPDIIVHHRGTDENLLVIEMKKNALNKPDEFDSLKLKEFKKQLGYQFAVALRIKTGYGHDHAYSILHI